MSRQSGVSQAFPDPRFTIRRRYSQRTRFALVVLAASSLPAAGFLIDRSGVLTDDSGGGSRAPVAGRADPLADAGAAPGGDAEFTGPATVIDNRVFVIGDSVVQAAAPYLGAALPAWSITADTRVGRFTEEGVRIVSRRRSEIGDVVVVCLGNNYGGDKSGFESDVNDMLERLEGVDHVLWLNVAEFRNDRLGVNQVLRSAARTRPGMVIVDWLSSWRKDPTLTASDDLHLTPKGAKGMAFLIAASVETVTKRAHEVPRPGVKAPVLKTGGSIPGSSGRKQRSSDSGGAEEVDLSSTTWDGSDESSVPPTTIDVSATTPLTGGSTVVPAPTTLPSTAPTSAAPPDGTGPAVPPG